MTIFDLPLEIWTIVFKYLNHCKLVEMFNTLEYLGIFDVKFRLVTFWIVVSESRHVNPVKHTRHKTKLTKQDNVNFKPPYF